MEENCVAVTPCVEQHRAVQDAAAAALGDGCTFARNESRLGDPPETNWCMYDDEVDLRIIIMTFNRPASLLRLLRSVVVDTKNYRENYTAQAKQNCRIDS